MNREEKDALSESRGRSESELACEVALGLDDSGAWLHKLNPSYWLKSKQERKFVDAERQAWIDNAYNLKQQRKRDKVMAQAQRALAAKQASAAAYQQAAELDAQLRAIETEVTGDDYVERQSHVDDRDASYDPGQTMVRLVNALKKSLEKADREKAERIVKIQAQASQGDPKAIAKMQQLEKYARKHISLPAISGEGEYDEYADYGDYGAPADGGPFVTDIRPAYPQTPTPYTPTYPTQPYLPTPAQSAYAPYTPTYPTQPTYSPYGVAPTTFSPSDANQALVNQTVTTKMRGQRQWSPKLLRHILKSARRTIVRAYKKAGKPLPSDRGRAEAHWRVRYFVSRNSIVLPANVSLVGGLFTSTLLSRFRQGVTLEQLSRMPPSLKKQVQTLVAAGRIRLA